MMMRRMSSAAGALLRRNVSYKRTSISSVCHSNAQRRSVWSTGQSPTTASFPLSALTVHEMKTTSAAVKKHLQKDVRFITITLLEPPKHKTTHVRSAEVVVLDPKTGIATELTVELEKEPTVTKCIDLAPGVQPMFTPEDCDLAEEICKTSAEVQAALKERYGIDDMSRIAADPWSVHLADEHDKLMTEGNPPRRLVQTFLYQRVQGVDLEDNHYAHPIDIVPVVDLNTQTVVRIDGMDRLPAPAIPQKSVNYHRNLLKTNSYLETEWRSDRYESSGHYPTRRSILYSHGQ